MDTSRVYHFDGVTLDLETMRLSRGGNEVALEPKSFHLLEFLIVNRDRVVSKEEIFRVIWKDVVVTDNALTRAITQIRKAVNDDPRKPRFIETVPKVGYRFIASIEFPRQKSASAQPLPEVIPAESGRNKLTLRMIRVVSLAGVICIAAVGRWLAHSMRKSPTMRAMAVLPLENLSGDARQDYFAEGMTDELVTQLTRIPNLRIAALNTDGGKKAQKPLREIAEDLNVDGVVEGSVVRSGDLVRINARLVDVRNDKNLWSNSVEGRAENILGLEDELAAEIASQARLAFTTQTSGGKESRKVNAAAHDAYLRGLYYNDRRDVKKSLAAFQAAVDADPTYAEAYARLSVAVIFENFHGYTDWKDAMPRASALALKSIELDPKLAQGYFALGFIDIAYTWDWTSAERNFAKGLELDPNDAAGEMMYSIYLDAVNRPAEAVDTMRRAVESEPLSFFMARQLGSTLYWAGRYDEAIEQLQLAKRMQSEGPDVVDNWFSWIYERKGMHDEAVKYDLLSGAQSLPQSTLDRLRSTYEREGWKSYWQARLDLIRQAGNEGCGPYESAVLEVRLGEHDRALADLNQAAQNKCFWMQAVAVDPMLDDLRNEPHFQMLLARMNLLVNQGQQSFDSRN